MRILFVTSNRIGDAVLSTGALAWLHRQHPEARFTIACSPLVEPLFTQAPNLERIIQFKKRRAAMHWVFLWSQCALTYWSRVVDVRRSGLSWLLPAGRRHILAPGRPGLHKVRQVGEMLGLGDPPAPTIWTGPDQDAAAEKLVPDGPPVLALAPTANWPGKQWPADRYVALIKRLTGAKGVLPGARLAVLSAPDERRDALEVLDAVPARRRIDLAGTVDLLTAYACLRRCALFVGNDSGLMHLAAASGTPTLGLFGPSKDEHYAPWGDRTAVVRTIKSHDELMRDWPADDGAKRSRMESLQVDAVVEAAERLRAKSSGVTSP